MRVRFIVPWTAYDVGADPTLADAQAAELIERGLCVPFDWPAPVVVDSPIAYEPEPVVVDLVEPAAVVEPTKRKRRK